jgi:hypothetical protein
MACQFGNCNDANCVAGDSTDVNGNPCDDASCSPCGSIAVTGGAAANTVPPNPSINNQNSTVNALTQLTGAFGTWGATIAGIVTGVPTVSKQTGFSTGMSAGQLSPTLGVMGAGGLPFGMIVVVVVIIAVVAAMGHK